MRFDLHETSQKFIVECGATCGRDSQVSLGISTSGSHDYSCHAAHRACHSSAFAWSKSHFRFFFSKH